MALKTTMVSEVGSRIYPTDVLLLGDGDEKLEDYICVENTNVTTRLFKVEVNENLWQDEEKQIEDIKGSISFEEEIKKLDEEEITKKK